ncbi:MAG: CBS domain-containing protein [Actinomycetia bacterium]|nr:CBS domain-containing protein [Actinomycetes bacterium]
MDLVVTHIHTDFDALASLVAARCLFPEARAALGISLNRNVEEFVRLHADDLELTAAAAVAHSAVRRLIVVETSRAERLGPFEELARSGRVEVLLFDNHPGEAPDWVPSANVIRSDDAALTTTFVGILAERSVTVRPTEATLFALGIHEDTGSLTYPTTTERDVDAVAWCLRHGARQEALARYLHKPLGESERALFTTLLESVETLEVAGAPITLACARAPGYVDGVSRLAEKLRDLIDLDALVCLFEMEGKTVMVVRSAGAELDAASLARALGGGGHAEAASSIIHAVLDTARAELLSALPDAVEKPRTARMVMSTPARFVEPDETITRAMAFCQRHGQSGLLVGSSDALIGAVTREDLDKALSHELAHAPVRAVMRTVQEPCLEDTPLPEVRRLLEVSRVGRIPVTRDSTVVGVVTSGDLLRELANDAQGEQAAGPAVSVRSRLEALTELEPVFTAIQAAAHHYAGVYLVGGAVRDVLLDERAIDVDVAVEGDAIEFARELASLLDGRTVSHERFNTAVVLHASGRVDVATTRTEFYDAPAALPSVEQAALRQDLFRRDFTINAMAASLRGETFGTLIDFFGGRADLDSGVIRVLHGLSFIDDPTRIFRAIRYENRYGFSMDPHTSSLARACIDMGLVGELSTTRLRDELVALLSEPDVAAALARTEELGLAAAIHPQLAVDAETTALIARLDELRAQSAPDVPHWQPRLAALARRLPPSELLGWFEHLKLRRRDAQPLASAITIFPRLVEQLREVTEPSTAHQLIQRLDPHGLLLAMASAPAGPAQAWLTRYATELRDIRLSVTGADLAELGLAESPLVGTILEELMRQKVNGELADRAQEIEAARALIEGRKATSETATR